jgi:hypothetical protein
MGRREVDIHVVMYDFLERVLSDCFLQASCHASSLGDWLHANSAYEIYNTHLCLFLADSAFNQLSLSLYLETVMGLPRLLSISRILRSHLATLHFACKHIRCAGRGSEWLPYEKHFTKRLMLAVERIQFLNEVCLPLISCS